MPRERSHVTASIPVYDAVVVGAGPAGTMAAHELAQGGARVLLVEKARLPRYKPCGGGLTARARAVSPLVPRFAPEARAGTILLPCRRQLLSCPLPSPLTMVMRDQFDAYLAARAVAAGAELRDGSALTGLERAGRDVRLVAGGETVTARYVVGADGATGTTARLASFAPVSRTGAPAIEVELAVPDAVRARYADAIVVDALAVHGGYGWIFSKGEHLSVGVGALLPAGQHTLRASLTRFLATHAGLSEGRTLLQRGHSIPLAGQRTAWRRGPIVLAGDAAGLGDPLTGEGISYALASGRRAGRAVLDALGAEPGALDRYERFIAGTLGGDLRYARWVAALAYRYPVPFLEALAAHEELRTVVAHAICGALPYRTLARRLMRRAASFVPYVTPAHEPGGFLPESLE
jgi:geranylgeranyl reductase family protein